MARPNVKHASGPQTLSTIQSLRGFAALAVLIAHVQPVEAKFGATTILGNWVFSGFGGVDLFFVISGFVMVWVTRDLAESITVLPRFWLQRLVRIYPLWWLVLSAIVAVWLVRPDLVYSSSTQQPDILRSYLLLPATTLPLHAVGWTLIFELWFYLIFGLLLLCPRHIRPALMLGWGTLVVIGALLLPNPSDPFLDLIRDPLTLEFIMGAAIGLLAVRRALRWGKPILWCGCILLTLSILSLHGEARAVFEAEWPRIFYFGIPCAMIVWGWVSLEQTGETSSKWSQAMGNWSYALYLIHVPVIAVVGRALQPMAAPGLLDNIVVLVVAIATSVAAAWVLYVAFEKPVQKLARRFTRVPS